jgi:hypothetical protein
VDASRACGVLGHRFDHERLDDDHANRQELVCQMRLSSPYLVVICIDSSSIHQETPPPSLAQVSMQFMISHATTISRSSVHSIVAVVEVCLQFRTCSTSL